MSSELLVIFIIALIVFGPKKLPMVATHLGFLLHKLNQLKEQATVLWQQQLKEYQFQENQRQAEKADKQYTEH